MTPDVGKTIGEEWYARVFGRLYDLLAHSLQPKYIVGDTYTRDRVREVSDAVPSPTAGVPCVWRVCCCAAGVAEDNPRCAEPLTNARQPPTRPSSSCAGGEGYDGVGRSRNGGREAGRRGAEDG